MKIYISQIMLNTTGNFEKGQNYSDSSFASFVDVFGAGRFSDVIITSHKALRSFARLSHHGDRSSESTNRCQPWRVQAENCHS